MGEETQFQRQQYTAAAQGISSGVEFATGEAEAAAYQREAGVDPGAGARAEREARKKKSDDDVDEMYGLGGP